MRPVRTYILGIALGVMSVATLGCPPAGQGEKAGQTAGKAKEGVKGETKEAEGTEAQPEEAAKEAAGAEQGAGSQPKN